MPQVSLMGPNPAQPFDMQAEQARLQIAQQLAQALLTGSLTDSSPTVDAGGVKMANIAEPIGKLFQGRAANAMLQDTLQKQAGLSREYQAGLSKDLQGYMALRRGTPDSVVGGSAPADELGGGPPAIARGKPGDVAAAISSLLASRYPEAQKMGEKQVGELPTSKDFLTAGDKYDPAGMAAYQASLNPADLAGRGQVQLTQQGAVVPTRDGQVSGPITPSQTYSPPALNQDTGLLMQRSNLTGQEAAFSGGNTTPANSFQNLQAAQITKQLETGRASYIDSIGKLGDIGQIQRTIESVPGSSFGSLGETRQAVNKFLGMLTGEVPDNNANIDVLQARLGSILTNGDTLRKFAPVSNTDIDQIKATVGSLGMTKPALLQVMKTLESATTRSMQQHEDFVKAAGEQYPGLVNPQMWIPNFSTASQNPVGAPAAPPTPTPSGWSIKPL